MQFAKWTDGGLEVQRSRSGGAIEELKPATMRLRGAPMQVWRCNRAAQTRNDAPQRCIDGGLEVKPTNSEVQRWSSEVQRYSSEVQRPSSGTAPSELGGATT